MKHQEWTHLKQIVDNDNPFSTLYECDDGSRFYIEPAFYTQLQRFKELYPQSYRLIINEMDIIVKKNHKVIFVYSYENPLTKKDGFIYREITDVTDPLKIFAEDKSRGSDYGD